MMIEYILRNADIGINFKWYFLRYKKLYDHELMVSIEHIPDYYNLSLDHYKKIAHSLSFFRSNFLIL